MINDLMNYIDQKDLEMLKMIETLVNMDSGSRYKKEVDILGDLLKNKWEEIGFSIEKFIFEQVGNCYIARINENSFGEKVVLIGHFDTVFPKGEARLRPFTVDGNKAFGPGVGDMKSGIVTMFYAVKALRKQGYLKKPISVILNSHEEIGSAYARELINSEVKDAKLVFNLEPARPNGAVVTGRKGTASLDINISGKAAHAGVEPEKGANANLELAERIIELNKLNGLQEGLTINANIISGGSARGIISDQAKAECAVHFNKISDIGYLKRKIEELFFKPKVKGTKIETELKILFLPLEKNNNTMFAYNIITEAGEKLGIKIKEAFTGGGADAGFASQNGIPTLCGMGPVAGNLHSSSEYLEIPSITERCKLLALSLMLFWQRK
ncbi:MAG: M20 family metallopeptidase [Atribacterota bacterium]|nr:M20 family metallopeptidase [Atribacterota bacterium]